jgi:hypothetical protein
MDVAQFLSSLGGIALIVGIGVGLFQLRDLSRQRQEEMVVRAYTPWFDAALTLGYWRVHRWNFDSFEAFDAAATLEDRTSFDQVATFFEMMGVLYKRGVASLDLLDDLFAGTVLITWNKIAPLVRGYRVRESVPDYGQWFEHLAHALDQRLTDLKEPHPAPV